MGLLGLMIQKLTNSKGGFGTFLKVSLLFNNQVSQKQVKEIPNETV